MKSLIKPIYASIKNPVINNSGNIASQPGNYVNNVVQAIITIFFIVGLFYFIWHFIMSAYQMISSQGDPEKWKKAQQSILYSLVGVFLVFIVFALLRFIGTILGIQGLSDLKITWPNLSP